MESHYLNAVEIESSAQKPLAEMERGDYLNQIQALTDTVTQLRDLLKSVTQALESVNKQSEKKDLQIERQTLIIEDLKNEVRNLAERLAHMRKDRFGSPSLKTRKGTESSNSRKSRDEEKQDYDGSKKEEAPSSENSSDGRCPSAS